LDRCIDWGAAIVRQKLSASGSMFINAVPGVLRISRSTPLIVRQTSTVETGRRFSICRGKQVSR